MAELNLPIFGDKSREQVLEDLREVRWEIARLNRAAGETIFNPAATQALDGLISELEAEQGVEVAHDIAEGAY
jgi:hypothetical protein